MAVVIKIEQHYNVSSMNDYRSTSGLLINYKSGPGLSTAYCTGMLCTILSLILEWGHVAPLSPWFHHLCSIADPVTSKTE